MKKIILMSLITTVIITSTAFARMDRRPGDMTQGPEYRHGMRSDENCPGGMFFGNPEAMKARLGLSDDQVDKIAGVNLDYKKKLLKIRENIEPKKIKLHGLLLEDNVNLKDVRSLLEEISALEVDIRILRINHQLDIEKILSPVQKNKLKNSRGGLMGM